MRLRVPTSFSALFEGSIDAESTEENERTAEWYWAYAAIDLDIMLLLDIKMLVCDGTDPAVAFCYRLTEDTMSPIQYFSSMATVN